MKEYPILFSGPMVRAILEGRKTQTRRPVKNLHPEMWIGNSLTKDLLATCPYGQPGDRLWVRETWALSIKEDGTPKAHYAADEEMPPAMIAGKNYSVRRPSIHMPRWASRITLEVARVRVERLDHISIDDVQAEGYERNGAEYVRFLRSFESIYKLPELANPWVWVVEFKRV